MENETADRLEQSGLSTIDAEPQALELSDLQQVAGGVWQPPPDEFLGVYPGHGCIWPSPWIVKRPLY